MSKMIPSESIDALRKQVNVSLDLYGIECDLYIPNNLDETEQNDIYQKPSDYEFDHYTVQLFIEWNPNTYRLKAKGLYTDGETPIIVKVPYEAVDDDGNTVDIEVYRHSYITVPIEYVPDDFQGSDGNDGEEEFELVDILVEKFHDAVIVKTFKAVPRRYSD